MRGATKTDHYEVFWLRWKETCIFIKTALHEPGKLGNNRTYLDKPESSRGILWWCSADGRTQSVRYSTSLFRSFTSWWSNNSSLFAIICHQKQQQTIKYSLLLTALSAVILIFIQSFPFRITVVFEKSGFTHSKNTNHINQLAEFTLYLQGLMTDRKVPHISENQRHEEDNAKSSYEPSPSCQTFPWFQ